MKKIYPIEHIINKAITILEYKTYYTPVIYVKKTNKYYTFDILQFDNWQMCEDFAKNHLRNLL